MAFVDITVPEISVGEIVGPFPTFPSKSPTITTDSRDRRAQKTPAGQNFLLKTYSQFTQRQFRILAPTHHCQSRFAKRSHETSLGRKIKLFTLKKPMPRLPISAKPPLPSFLVRVNVRKGPAVSIVSAQHPQQTQQG